MVYSTLPINHIIDARYGEFAPLSNIKRSIDIGIEDFSISANISTFLPNTIFVSCFKQMKRLLDFQKIIGYSDERYPFIDPTTPWAEFNYYCEACKSLGVSNQPHMNRYMAYRSYLKSVGVL